MILFLCLRKKKLPKFIVERIVFNTNPEKYNFSCAINQKNYLVQKPNEEIMLAAIYINNIKLFEKFNNFATAKIIRKAAKLKRMEILQILARNKINLHATKISLKFEKYSSKVLCFLVENCRDSIEELFEILLLSIRYNYLDVVKSFAKINFDFSLRCPCYYESLPMDYTDLNVLQITNHFGSLDIFEFLCRNGVCYEKIYYSSICRLITQKGCIKTAKYFFEIGIYKEANFSEIQKWSFDFALFICENLEFFGNPLITAAKHKDLKSFIYFHQVKGFIITQKVLIKSLHCIDIMNYIIKYH